MKVGESLTINAILRDEDANSVLTAISHSYDRHWAVPSTINVGEPLKIYLRKEYDFEQESWSWLSIEAKDNGVSGDSHVDGYACRSHQHASRAELQRARYCWCL